MLLNLVNSLNAMSSHFYKQDCLQEKNSLWYGILYKFQSTKSCYNVNFSI